MSFRMPVVALAFLPLAACGATLVPAPYVQPSGFDAPEGPVRKSVLTNSKPLLTVECRGELVDPTGEVCFTYVAGYVAEGVRNVAVRNAEAIARFQQLEGVIAAELGAPEGRWTYVATQVGRTPDFSGQNCNSQAIRTSVPGLEDASEAANAAAAAGSLCMDAVWETPTEDVLVTLVPAMTSALDGPMAPQPEVAGHYALRLKRTPRDPVIRNMRLDAKISAADAP